MTTKEKIRIKKGDLVDLLEISEITKSNYGVIFESEIKDWFHDAYLMWMSFNLLTIVDDNKIIGYAFWKATPCLYLTRKQMYPEQRGFMSGSCQNQNMGCERAMFIADIAIRKDCQRKGLGTKLLEEIIKEAKTNKIKRIFLQSWLGSPNNSSYNFFEKHGFEEQICIKNYYSNGDYAGIMCKKNVT